jgi:hypothetical protein
MDSPLLQSEILTGRFNRLMQDITRDSVKRTEFSPWEVELMLDMQGCQMRERSRSGTLKRYQKMAVRAIENGAQAPPKLSEFLAGASYRRRRSTARP